MKKKSLSFTKSDILTALAGLAEDDGSKGIIVERLLAVKISRLRDDLSAIHEEFDMIMDGAEVTKKNISNLSNERRKELSLLQPRIMGIIHQIEEYQNLYDEFSENATFDNANLGGFKSKLKQIFQWNGY